MGKIIVIFSTLAIFCLAIAIIQSCVDCGGEGPDNYRLVSISAEAKRNNLELLSLDAKANFFNSAFACDQAVNFNVLEDITITSSADYSSNYPAGTDLKQIMSVREGYSVEGETIQRYLAYARLREQNLFFTFNSPPSDKKVHDVTIKYKLADGREYDVFISGLTIN